MPYIRPDGYYYVIRRCIRGGPNKDKDFTRFVLYQIYNREVRNDIPIDCYTEDEVDFLIGILDRMGYDKGRANEPLEGE
jgi:hypothetical protein